LVVVWLAGLGIGRIPRAILKCLSDGTSDDLKMWNHVVLC
jgi:hypothetical protein